MKSNHSIRQRGGHASRAVREKPWPSEKGSAGGTAGRTAHRPGKLGARCLLILLALGPAPLRAKPTDDRPLSVTGAPVPELESFDRAMLETIRKRQFPGGSLAVAKNGRLVLARGYGLADSETGGVVEPESLFRIASLSKPITSAVILKLVAAGKLDLDAKALDLLSGLGPPPGKHVDPGWRQISVRQLLHHTAGFDRDKSFDPMCDSRPVAKGLGIPSPPDQKAIIRYMLGQPLDFDPGTKYAYSNFGYCVLGRIIERVTGKSYEEAGNELVLAPAGVTRMRLGHTALGGRLPREVRYQASTGDAPGPSIFDNVKGNVAAPYGLYHIDAMDSHGGWVSSAVDLARFATAADGSRKPGLFPQAVVRLIESPPAPPLPTDSKRYYGLGWNIRVLDHGANWAHSGKLSGAASMMVRFESGVIWVALFNRNSDDDSFYVELERTMQGAIDNVKSWPAHDLFSKFK